MLRPVRLLMSPSVDKKAELLPHPLIGARCPCGSEFSGFAFVLKDQYLRI